MAAPLCGRRVIVSGITGRAELNGRTGTAESFNDENGKLNSLDTLPKSAPTPFTVTQGGTSCNLTLDLSWVRLLLAPKSLCAPTM